MEQTVTTTNDDMKRNNLFRSVAANAYTSVIDAWNDFLYEDNSEEDDCELYLYVFLDGHWVIDHCQYFTGWNELLTLAPISNYVSAEELQAELELSSHELCIF